MQTVGWVHVRISLVFLFFSGCSCDPASTRPLETAQDAGASLDAHPSDAAPADASSPATCPAACEARLLPLDETPVAALNGIYDPVGDRLIAFGVNGSNQTWALPLSDPAPSWSVLETTGDAPAIIGKSAYDSLRHRLLLLSFYPDGGLWSLSLTELHWEQIEAENTPTNCSALFYHDVSGQLLAFGCQRYDLLSRFDPATATWTTLLSETLRHPFGAVLDARGDQLIFIQDPPQDPPETWVITEVSSSVPSVSRRLSNGPSASITTGFDPIERRVIAKDLDGYLMALEIDALLPEWQPIEGTGPRQRSFQLVYDNRRHQLLLPGGTDMDEGIIGYGVQAYDLAANSWSAITADHPAPLTWLSSSIGYDARRDQLVFVDLRDRVWTRALDEPRWTLLLESEGPSGVGRLLWEERSDRFITLGSSDYDCFCFPLWRLQLSPPGWTPLDVSLDQPYLGMFIHHGQLMVPLQDGAVLLLDDDSWQSLETAGAPPTSTVRCAYTDDRLICPGPDRLWTLDPDRLVWSQQPLRCGSDPIAWVRSHQDLLVAGNGDSNPFWEPSLLSVLTEDNTWHPLPELPFPFPPVKVETPHGLHFLSLGALWKLELDCSQ